MTDKKKKIAVSGAGGALGGQILAMAADEGLEVVALTSKPEVLQKKI